MVSCTPSWFWGPVITLEDCLAAFFAADELKGEWTGLAWAGSLVTMHLEVSGAALSVFPSSPPGWTCGCVFSESSPCSSPAFLSSLVDKNDMLDFCTSLIID